MKLQTGILLIPRLQSLISLIIQGITLMSQTILSVAVCLLVVELLGQKVLLAMIFLLVFLWMLAQQQHQISREIQLPIGITITVEVLSLGMESMWQEAV